MPIVDLPRPGSPLSQGDILQGITLFVTRGAWLEFGGEAAKASFKMCLVLSRPCVLMHKRHVTVAGVDKYPDSVPRGIDTFDKVLDFLTSARDGIVSPDVFYLGQLPGLAGRYCARLDSFHALEIPTDPAVRERFLNDTRVATLQPDFARNLHVRLFNAFASLGFDDHQWLSTEDLAWLVSQGKVDLAAAEQAVNQHRAVQASRLAEGKQLSEGDLTGAEGKWTALQQKLAPFERELARRQEKGDSP